MAKNKAEKIETVALGTLANGCTLAQAETARILIHYERNFRAFECLQTAPTPNFDPSKDKSAPGLYENILLNGIMTPILLSELEESRREEYHREFGEWYDFIVLRGHRRMHVVSQINATNPDNPQFPTVPAMIYKGLTIADEFRLMADQGGGLDYNDYEIYDQIKKLVMNTRMSEEAIANQLSRPDKKISRGYVQRRKWIMSMPQWVEDNFRLRYTQAKDENGKPIPYVNITDKTLQELNKAVTADRETNTDPTAEGSKFKTVWDNFVEKGNPTLSGNAPIKPLSKSELETLHSSTTDPILRTCIEKCMGKEVDWHSAVQEMKTLRRKAEG